MKYVLILSNVRPIDAGTIHDHQSALINDGGAFVHVVNPVVDREVLVDFSRFDVVIIHYTLVCFMDNFISQDYRRALREFRGLKAIFIQDEYRFINSAVDAMLDLGVDVLFTLVSGPAIDTLYGRLKANGVRIETTLTGYVPDTLVAMPKVPLAERPLDVIYRGRLLPYHLGRLGTEKVFISETFAAVAPRYGLKFDVDWREESRIYGDDWKRFLSSGRTALASESGASICDFTGDLDRRLKEFMILYPEATYEDAYSAFLYAYEGNVVMNVISPRVFESVALGTALVQFPGDYSGVLEADEHYIVLRKDFSNIGEVVDRIRDIGFLERLTDRAYDDLIRSGAYSYRQFAERTFAVIREEWERRVQRHPHLPAFEAELPALPDALPDRGPAAEEWRRSLAEFRERFRQEESELLAAAAQAQERRRNEPKDRWHSEIEEEILFNRRLHLPPRDLARANLGAQVVSSCAFFNRPYEADYLLREPSPGGYASARPGQENYFIDIDLGQIAVVGSVKMSWFDEHNYPRRVVVEKSLTGERWTGIADIADNHGAETVVDMQGGVPARRVRISTSDFEGQPRMLLRRLEILEKRGADHEAPGSAQALFNALDSRRGASVVASSSFFPEPNGPDYLLGELTKEGYAAARKGAEACHWIEFDLGHVEEIALLELKWLSEKDLATRFWIETKSSPDDEWERQVSSDDNGKAAVAIDTGALQARFIRLSADQFSNQPRMLVREFKVWALSR